MFDYLFSAEFLTGLVTGWSYAVIGGVLLLFLASLSRVLAEKTGRPEINVAFWKKVVYFAVGVGFLLSLASAVRFPVFFIGELTYWLTLSYIFVAVAEWKLVSLKEAMDFIFPWFYKWWEKKEIKKGDNVVEEVNEDNLSYFELAKLGYRIRFGLKASEPKKPKAPIKKPTTAQVWKIQLWFIFGTALFVVLIALSGGFAGY